MRGFKSLLPVLERNIIATIFFLALAGLVFAMLAGSFGIDGV